MRIQPLSYLTFFLSLPLRCSQHKRRCSVDAIRNGDGRTASASGSRRLAHVSANV